MKIGMFLSLVILISPATAQTDSSQDGTRSAVCTFEDGKQMSVRYNGNASGAKLKNGQLWPNADPPMLLFTQASLRIENSSIPIGAYGVYVIPGTKLWTLVVNKNVNGDHEYDQKDDLVRASMATGQLSDGKTRPRVYLAHDAPQRCEFRFYYGKTGASLEINEQ